MKAKTKLVCGYGINDYCELISSSCNEGILTILSDISNTKAYKDWKDRVHSLIKPSNERYWENYNMDFICKVHAFPYWQFHIKRFHELINKPYTEAGLRELIEYRDSHYPGLKMQKRGRPRKLN